MWDLIEKLASIAAVVGLPFAVYFGWKALRQKARDDLMVQIRAESTRSDLIRTHHNTRSGRYYGYVAGTLAWAEKFYGPRWSVANFERCLTMAFVYPLIAAVIAWVLIGQTDLGTLTFFLASDSIVVRAFRACVFLTLITIAVLALKNLDQISLFGKLKSQKLIAAVAKPEKKSSKAAVIVAELGSGFVSGAVAALLTTFAVSVVSADLASAFAASVAVAVALNASFAVGSACFSAVFIFLLGNFENSILVVFLYLLLPFANAFADWVSVSLTRWFLQDAERHRYGAWALMGYMLLDFFAGLACLALLLSGLVALLELWSLFATPPLDWRAYWAAAQVDRSAGIALWVMCFTTLLPTLVHVAFALAIWLFGSPEPMRMAVEEMRHWDDTSAEADQTARAMRVADQIQRGRRVQWMRAGVVFAVLATLAVWLEIWTLTTGLQLVLDAPLPAGT